MGSDCYHKTSTYLFLSKLTGKKTVKLFSENGNKHSNYLTEDEDDVNPNKCYLNPNSRPAKIWNIVVVFLLLYVAVETPIAFSFKEIKVWSTEYILDLAIDALFFIDLISNCFFAYTDEQTNKLVIDNKKIFKRYLKSWFFIDLSACFPS